MKKLIILSAVVLLALNLSASPTEVNEKVLKIFKESFSDAKDVKWSELDNSYAVSFSMSGILTKVTYDKEGNILSSIRYYSPDRLPLNVMSSLKRKYSDKTFFGVTEIVAEEDVAYYVKMYDDKHWFTIKASSNGGSEVYEKYKRADAGKLKR